MKIIQCSQGHKFPINMEKHPTRTLVHCPKCKELIQIRKRFPWSILNPKWKEQKLHNAARKTDLHRMRERPERQGTPYIFAPEHAQTLGLLALSALIKQRQLEKEGAENASK